MKRRKILILMVFIITIFSVFLIANSVYKREIGYINERYSDNIKISSNSWDAEITRDVGKNPYSVSVGDINNDGYNDIVVSNCGDNNVSIFIWNSSLNTWNTELKMNVGLAPWRLHLGDANNDGYNDIATANSDSDDVSIILWNYSINDWEKEQRITVGKGPEDVFLGDVDNDGDNDIVTADVSDDNISIVLWNETYETWDPYFQLNVNDDPNSIYVGDVNADGDNDIVVSNPQSDDISIIIWNDSEETWNSERNINVGNGPNSVFIGDANNDGKNDIVATNMIRRNEIAILIWNNSKTDWNSVIKRKVGDWPYSIFIEDVNNDGYNDIATANYGLDNNSVSLLYWNNETKDWNDQIRIPVGDDPTCVFIADANNDGYNDIITANSGDYAISILLWNSDDTTTQVPGFEILITLISIIALLTLQKRKILNK
ncbi:MAG: hypothetical protein GF317_14865 [Candidatus Lokiarchaeota archaeon]|nr:hypothetical protein [Candidatus Lokiarchaeota archaeon]